MMQNLQQNVNGTWATTNYDPVGRMSQQVHSAAAGVLDFSFYDYDYVGRPTVKQTSDGLFTYQYDLVDQLIYEAGPKIGVRTYQYDEAFRRTLYHDKYGWTTSSYDAADQFLTRRRAELARDHSTI